MEGLLILAKILLLISIIIFLLAIGYLAYTNPNTNYELHQSNVNSQILQDALNKSTLDAANAQLKEWKYDYSSDVGISDDKYPIVVLRSGFKVLKLKSDSALVGWNYEIANTSPSSRYEVTVGYSLTDRDDFKIGTSTGTGIIQPKGYEKITGTINIGVEDLERLNSSTWTIVLNPSWSFNEKKTTGIRYERLEKFFKDIAPLWTYFKKDELIKHAKTYEDKKWQAVSKGLWGEEILNQNDASD